MESPNRYPLNPQYPIFSVSAETIQEVQDNVTCLLRLFLQAAKDNDSLRHLCIAPVSAIRQLLAPEALPLALEYRIAERQRIRRTAERLTEELRLRQ